jgi:molybdenum cofactor biosynthesis enzyme MoaA
MLRFEEISALVTSFLAYGQSAAHRRRPLLRRDVHALVRMIAVKRPRDPRSTNGAMLADQIDDLRAAGPTHHRRPYASPRALRAHGSISWRR